MTSTTSPTVIIPLTLASRFIYHRRIIITHPMTFALSLYISLSLYIFIYSISLSLTFSKGKMNNGFLLSCLVIIALLIFLAPRSSQATGRSFSYAPYYAARSQRPVSPRRPPSPMNVPFHGRAKEFESQKRRVPTGSNPLHNKKRL